MNKVKLLVLAVLLPLTAVAQTTVEKPLQCLPTEVLIKQLQTQYTEQVAWYGTEPNSQLPVYTLFSNEKTQTWTLVQFNTQVACILGSGTGSTAVITGSKV